MAERRINTLSDEALDRALSEALEVEPSPEFLPRVRARVAELTAPTGWNVWPTWTWPAAAAAVMAAVGVGLVVWTAHDRPVARQRAAALVPVVESAASAQLASDRSQPERSDSAPPPRSVALPVVQVSPDELRALRQLVAAVGAQRIEAAAIPDIDTPLAPLPALEEIVVDQIALNPLPAFEGQ